MIEVDVILRFFFYIYFSSKQLVIYYIMYLYWISSAIKRINYVQVVV